ncbi:glycosyltransferase family 8 protein [Karstenula rhodostoma CBS 690.94]|uniref:Glycosyltransferase family 8 protein n=1 Tax=Karstenula rhodostoma CBS 690.94 TaxID=1392251 RepID=A0A9P4PFA2_9PLEO|nr:glycosyltransferase family 8 protein [Karstenula rhodostoma CBS 690.94]
MEQWMKLLRFNSLRTSEDATDVETFKVRLARWFAIRRIRTSFFAATIILVLVLSIHFIDLTTVSRAVHQVKSDPPQISNRPPKVDDGVVWSNYAYVQYVTNENYLCNSLMILEALHRSGSKADKIMLFPENWQLSNEIGSENRMMLNQARERYETKLIPISVQTSTKGDPTWKDSFTKLLAFNQTQYKRVISLDSDATVKQHMDELFLTPSSPVAMPRAYWLDQPFLSSQLILLEPSTVEWDRIKTYIDQKDSGFDMDILNTIYKDSCIVLPHRRYNLISAEFRGSSESHRKYLGSEEAWNGTLVLEEAKFVHFSDWPLPKPWIKASESDIADRQPECRKGTGGGGDDCTDRDIWLNLYKDFSERRQRVCGHQYDKRDTPTTATSSHRVRSKYDFEVI